jgi:hypothetical protein
VPSSSPEGHPSGRASDVLLGVPLLRIEKLSFSWTFQFGDKIGLSTEAPWRVLSDSSILDPPDEGDRRGHRKTRRLAGGFSEHESQS